VNYIPAILTAICISLASKKYMDTLKISFKDGLKCPERNSEFPESAMAGAIGLRLGGANYYSGVKVIKPYLGDSSCREVGTIEDIKKSIKIMYTSSFVALFIGIILFLLCSRPYLLCR